MEPIRLTESGAMLTFSELKERVPDLSDDNRLEVRLPGIGCVVGMHMGAWVHLASESEEYNVLYCKNHCGLRVVFPREIRIFGELRQWCEFDISHPGLSAGDKRGIFLAKLAAHAQPPTSAEIVKAADKERERIGRLKGW